MAFGAGLQWTHHFFFQTESRSVTSGSAFLTASRTLARKIFESALTGARKFFRDRSHVPSRVRPPPVTRQCRAH